VGFDGGTVTFFRPKEFYHVHVVNSFENATGVTMDLGAMDSNPFGAEDPGIVTALFLNKTARDAAYATSKNCVRRFHFHLAGDLAGEVTEEDLLCDGFVDFFRVHPDYQGKAYCTYYATQWYRDHKTRADMAIVKHNVCTGEVSAWHKEAVYPGEAMLIPTGPGEDEGLLSFITLNGGKGTSEYVLLDARDLSEVAVVTLPEHVPFTAHGNFVTAPGSLSV
jgi:carotenoid cleavage dioxygenase-like enzyme